MKQERTTYIDEAAKDKVGIGDPKSGSCTNRLNARLVDDRSSRLGINA
jgi:hypothetical protein